jgi:DNA modification methylase
MRLNASAPIIQTFANIKTESSWAFADCTRAQTRYITHGYHTYPAKFIPQLAARLIRELSNENDIIVDPFMGSGTTIVEAMAQGRIGVGVDINPVAHLIAKVKSTPLEPESLKREYAQLENDLNARRKRAKQFEPTNDRIAYWFPKEQRNRLSILLERISEIRDEDTRDFFLVAFSQILKSCSIWLQRSIKPTRDLNKTPAEPFDAFLRQARYMLKQNQVFWDTLPARVRDNTRAYRTAECADARALPVRNGAARLIVTSPPYVTSYEYADLHQLTALWFEYCGSLPEFRKRFIGSASAERTEIDPSTPLRVYLKSEIAESICRDLGKNKKAREVRNYFADMLECFAEMQRTLKVGGKACIVIGDTELQGVKVLNAEVFVEQMQNIGYRVHTIIKREIPSKILPQTRDPHSGKFTSSANAKKVLAYPVEYILVMEKI